MNAIDGVILIAIAGVLLFFGRERAGAPRLFLGTTSSVNSMC